MSLFSRFRGFLILTLTLVVFTVSVFFSVDKMLKEQGGIIAREQENIIWATTRTEVELYRLLDSLYAYRNPESAVDQDAVNRRFDIFLSQFQTLRQGEFAERLRRIEGVREEIEAIWRRLEALEPSLIFLRKGDMAGVEKVVAELEGMGRPVNMLAVKALHQDETSRAERRERIESVYLELIGYFIGILVSGSILVLLLFRSMRRARKLLEERQRTEERLRESEGRFRDFASSSSDWLWETDERLRFTYFSKGYLEKIGVNAVSILGQTFSDVPSIEGDDDASRAFHNRMETRQPFREFRFTIRTDDGGRRHIKVSGVPNFDTEGNFLGYRGTGTDITAQVVAESEAERVRTLLAEAVEALAEGFAMFDPADRLVLCNSKFRELYPLTVDLIRPGVAFSDIIRGAVQRGQFSIPPGEEEAFIRLRLARYDEANASFEQRLADGRWLKVIDQRLPTGWRIGTRIDITDLKQREEMLRREALIWEQMHDGVMITDLRGRITNWNPAAELMFGYSADEALGRTPSMLRGRTGDEAFTRAILSDVVRDGRWSGEIEFRRRDGREAICETVVAPLRSDQDEVIAFLWVNHDISLRKRSEAALRSAKDQAETANRAKSQFLATMSHEIRTPMNGVLGMIDLLLDTGLSEEQRSYADTARESGEALLTIIDDILDFSKMEAGKLALETTRFELRHTVEGVVELLAPRAQAKDIEIAAWISPDVPVAVRGDPGRFRQVLLNLTGNAVKFTETGGVAVHVSLVGASQEKTWVKVEVIDTGVGIEPSRQADLFDEFTQVDPSYTRKYGGTGLGLAISKKLTELMGGEIALESQPGQGSTFSFTVAFEVQAGSQRGPDWAEEFDGLRIIAVDDVGPTREAHVRLLSSSGFIVEAAPDGPAALDLMQTAAAQGRPFDVALIDKTLPSMSGEELGRRIRGVRAIADTRLILATPLSDRGKADAFKRSGFDAHVTKPVRAAILMTRIAELTGRSLRPATAEPVVVEASAAEAVTTGLARQAQLLLAEDSKVNQVVATAMLEKAGYRVDVVNNGREALEAVQRRAYDLVLMDVSMPEMDGFDATHAIRHLPSEARRLPIIAMTAHAMAGDREKCLAAGMNDYVSKPVDRTNLLDTVGRWLGVQVEVDVSATRPGPPQREAGPRAAAGGAVAKAAAPAAGAGSESVLDEAVFDQLVSDTSPELLQELIRTFISETADRLRRMSEAAGEVDLAVLEAEAHALKSSSGAFGAQRLSGQARMLELAARQGQSRQSLTLLRPIHGMALEASRELISRSAQGLRAAE